MPSVGIQGGGALGARRPEGLPRAQELQNHLPLPGGVSQVTHSDQGRHSGSVPNLGNTGYLKSLGEKREQFSLTEQHSY